MDPSIGWYQPEQFGPAKDLWLHIWEAEKGLDVLTSKHEPSSVMNKVLPVPDNSISTLTDNYSRTSDDRDRANPIIRLQQVQHNSCNSYYNPSRRKNDNRASTYGMNYNYNALVGAYGGCPWRVQNKHYSKGVIG